MSDPAILPLEGLGALIEALHRDGYQVVGPRLRDGAIVYDDLPSAADLPAGWTDVQEAGTYRVQRRDDEARFGYAVGPHSWKGQLHPSRLRLWRAERAGDGVEVTAEPPPAKPFALIGVRSCDLHAIATQDQVFLGGAYVDPHYQARRQDAFIVAVNCGVAGGTCFCVSMGTGPKAEAGYDLALTELLDEPHRFLIEAGTARGAALLGSLPTLPATPADTGTAESVLAHTRASMGRKLETHDLPHVLLSNLEHPRWEDVATRCLTCGNCTMVCPTCFCTSVEDTSDLAGGAERSRRWDSCFHLEFSYVHGGSVRKGTASRYRQWMTHKLATWWQQFDRSGCVGCGRCITWCPVGIDITVEAAAIRATPGSPPRSEEP